MEKYVGNMCETGECLNGHNKTENLEFLRENEPINYRLFFKTLETNYSKPL